MEKAAREGWDGYVEGTKGKESKGKEIGVRVREQTKG